LRMESVPGIRTIGGWLEDAESRLTHAEVESARLSAYMILEEVTGFTRSKLIAHPEDCLSTRIVERAEELLARRLDHEPMAYLLGRKEFRNLSLQVTPDVLIPRPETEGLVDMAVRLMPDADKILDAGTGSGCLALSLLECYPNGLVLGCDRSREALHVASGNDSDRRVRWFQADWLSAISKGSLDLVVSNPPYLTKSEMESLAPQVACYEPFVALNSSADGCDAYRVLIPQARRCLRPGGWLVLEIGPSVVTPVRVLLKENGFRSIQMRRDLAGRARYAAGVIRG
jgi:release factor glutamine methyltransferase